PGPPPRAPRSSRELVVSPAPGPVLRLRRHAGKSRSVSRNCWSHLHDEGPQLDRLADGLTVVGRVSLRVFWSSPGTRPFEQCRGLGLDRLDGRTVSSYGPREHSVPRSSSH